MQNQNRDLKDMQELEIFAKSNAGQMIITQLNKEVNDMMFKFVAELQNPTLNKYIALSCELKEKLELIKKFTKAGDIRKVIEDSISKEIV